MGVDSDAAAAVATEPRTRAEVLALFAVLWAMATLFHVWGPSGSALELFSHRSTLGLWQALAGGVAVAVLVRPRSLPLLIGLAALGPVTLWYETPIAGSHWVLATLVDLALLLALIAARDRDRLESIFLPLGRCVLVGFYFFAAFAKLNHAFFTPRASCGNFYFDELTASLHLSVHSATAGWWSHLVPFGVAATEMSIPVLLCIRRTRHIGIVVGLLFHSMIALDQTHPFSDFSSVLLALFVLFLPASFASEVMRRFRDGLRALVAGACAVLLLVQWRQGSTRLFRDGLGWAWVVFDVVVLALVAQFLLRERPAPIERPISFARYGVPRWLAIVPLLVLLNGLSPYLELRTAYAFNMYSNLQTADGESNHFLVMRTLPLTDFESDLVRITATNDPGLQLYVGQFDLPFLQLRDYLSRHPNVSLTYVRGGVERSVARAADDPALVEPVPSWQSKLFAFRSVDQTEPARCQPSFLPAL
jgi:hypothetical protein